MNSKNNMEKNDAHEWDFFLAHAGADLSVAEELFSLLSPYKIFLDSKSLLLGDEWDRELPLAQTHSSITVVLVSSNTDQAYYEREEIAAAIAMARLDKTKHRVVPVFLDDEPDETKVPYGLLRKHSLYLSKEGELSKIADKLKNLIETITRAKKNAQKFSPSVNAPMRLERTLLDAISRFNEDELLAEVVSPLVAVLHPGRIDYVTVPNDPNRILISSGSDRLRKSHILHVQLKPLSGSMTPFDFEKGSRTSLAARKGGIQIDAPQSKPPNEVWLITPFELDENVRQASAQILTELDRWNIKFIHGYELAELMIEHLPDVASRLSRYSTPEVIGLISALSRHAEGKAFGLSTDRTINSFYVTAALSPHATKAYAALRGDISVNNWTVSDEFPIKKLIRMSDFFLDLQDMESLVKKRAIQLVTKGILDPFSIRIHVELKESLTQIQEKFVEGSFLQAHDFLDLSSFIEKLKDSLDVVHP